MRIVKFAVAALVVFVIATVGFIYLAPEKATHFFVGLDRDRAGLVRKQIDLPNGMRFVYLEGGKGEPLMLVHGFAANKDHFTRTARLLTPHYHVIIPDLIGAGESALLKDIDYSPVAQAGYLRALAQALGIKQLHLGGSSMGGQISLSYAVLHPAEVKSLWLLAPGGIWSAPASEAKKIIEQTKRNPLLVKNEDDFIWLMNFAMTKPPFMPRPVLNVMAQERIRNYDLEQRIFNQITGDSIEPRVKGLTTSAMIVWGKDDRVLIVDSAEILHKLMPNSKVVLMPGIGHLPMLEQPEQSAEDYLKFMKSL